MQSKQIYYGVVGAGHIGNYHAQQIKNVSNVKLSGIYDVSQSQAKKVGKQYNAPVFHSLDSLLKECNVLTIATPAQSHFEIAIQALKNDCHIFIEKPITTNLQDADQIIELAKQKNLLVQVGHIERFNPAFVQLVTKKNINKAKFIESERLTPFNLRGLDVDVVLDLMIHDIDLILHIKQCAVKTIQALGLKVLSKTIDLANARLVFEDNTVANLTASRISDTAIRKLRLFNDQKYFSVNLQNPAINTYAVKNKPVNDQNTKLIFSREDRFVIHRQENIPKQNALYQELVSFISSIQSTRNTLVDASAGREAIKIALEIQKKINEEK
mgnify:CR=1 FL=1